MINLALYITYALIVIAAVSAIVLPLINSLSDPKQLAETGIGVGALVVVFLIAYVIAGSEVTAVYTKFDVDSSQSKMIGGGVIMMYIMILLVTIGIFFTEIISIFK